MQSLVIDRVLNSAVDVHVPAALLFWRLLIIFTGYVPVVRGETPSCSHH